MATKRCVAAAIWLLFWPTLSSAQAPQSECLKQLKPIIGVSGQSANSRTIVPMMSVLRTLGAEPVYLDQHAGRNPSHDLPDLHAIIIASMVPCSDKALTRNPLRNLSGTWW